MKKWLIGMSIGMLTVLSMIGLAADAVEPASLTITNLRSEAVIEVGDTYYTGSTLLLTNCVMFAGATTNSATQGLDTVTIEVRLGRASTNVAYDGFAILDAGGDTWYCTSTVPTDVVANQFSLQVKITDADSNVYIYPWKTLATTAALE